MSRFNYLGVSGLPGGHQLHKHKVSPLQFQDVHTPLVTREPSFLAKDCPVWPPGSERELEGLGCTIILTFVLPRTFLQDLDQANGRGGFGSQTAADPRRPSGNPENQTVGTVTHKMLLGNLASTFELSQCWHCKERLLEPRKGTSGSLSPERPCQFARYRRENGFIEGFSGCFLETFFLLKPSHKKNPKKKESACSPPLAHPL